MELITEEVCALADYESSILGAIGKHVDETLHDSEPRLLGVLILVRPGLVWGQIGAVGEAKVDGIKGNNEILVVVDLLENLDDAGLSSDLPGKVLVTDAVVDAHPLLINDRKMVFVNG